MKRHTLQAMLKLVNIKKHKTNGLYFTIERLYNWLIFSVAIKIN
jgi:hypothetical protein